MPLPPYDWDAGKAEANLAKHGVPFEAICAFDWQSAVQRVDDRIDYGGERRVALGMVGQRPHVVVYVLRADLIRLISMRKANPRELP